MQSSRERSLRDIGNTLQGPEFLALQEIDVGIQSSLQRINIRIDTPNGQERVWLASAQSACKAFAQD